MLKVTKIFNYGGACPFQLEGELEDGRQIYVRFRWSMLTISDGIFGPLLFQYSDGGDYNGYLEPEELVSITNGKFEWPPVETWDELVKNNE